MGMRPVISFDPALSVGKPVRSRQAGDSTYVLYRISGEFRARLEFHDFPFDHQKLPIMLSNLTLPGSRVVYVTDPDVLDQDIADKLRSGVNEQADFNGLTNWVVE